MEAEGFLAKRRPNPLTPNPSRRCLVPPPPPPPARAVLDDTLHLVHARGDGGRREGRRRSGEGAGARASPVAEPSRAASRWCSPREARFSPDPRKGRWVVFGWEIADLAAAPLLPLVSPSPAASASASRRAAASVSAFRSRRRRRSTLRPPPPPLPTATVLAAAVASASRSRHRRRPPPSSAPDHRIRPILPIPVLCLPSWGLGVAASPTATTWRWIRACGGSVGAARRGEV
ncbi:hypothetical protein DAI22_12g142750 [Oryza sativa Japonica Group]|nr:hypothetical protein DAI22_12g142750 [Oryza sativa Japonica Group]